MRDVFTHVFVWIMSDVFRHGFVWIMSDVFTHGFVWFMNDVFWHGFVWIMSDVFTHGFDVVNVSYYPPHSSPLLILSKFCTSSKSIFLVLGGVLFILWAFFCIAHTKPLTKH